MPERLNDKTAGNAGRADLTAAAFPAEGYAFAAVLLAADAKTGLFAAAVLFVISVIAAALAPKRSAASNALRVILGVVYMAVFCVGVFLMNGYSYQGHVAAIAAALLACLGFVRLAAPVEEEAPDAAEGAAEGAGACPAAAGCPLHAAVVTAALASALLFLCGIVRELLSAGSVFGLTVTISAAVSSFYGKTAIGLIAAGFLLAAVSAVRKIDFSGRGTVFVVLPAAVLLMIEARGIGGIAKQVFILIILLLALWGIRKRLRFSETGRPFRGMPVELIMSGLLYMVLSWL